MKIDPIVIKGDWDSGFSLDVHTLSSVPLGEDASGRMQFDNTRSELGEAVYQLKYRHDLSMLEPLAEATATFLRSKNLKSQKSGDLRPLLSYFSAILPVPPSDTSRAHQPVIDLALLVAKKVNLECPQDYLIKLKSTSALKNMADPEQRKAALADAFHVADDRFQGKCVILFDDLFRSGATMNAICSVLRKPGGVKYILAFTLTHTRVNQ